MLPPNTRFLGPGIFRVLEIRELEVRFSQLLIHEFSVYWKKVGHCSPESNLVKIDVLEKLTTDSEIPLHGDFKYGLG